MCYYPCRQLLVLDWLWTKTNIATCILLACSVVLAWGSLAASEDPARRGSFVTRARLGAASGKIAAPFFLPVFQGKDAKGGFVLAGNGARGARPKIRGRMLGAMRRPVEKHKHACAWLQAVSGFLKMKLDVAAGLKELFLSPPEYLHPASARHGEAAKVARKGKPGGLLFFPRQNQGPELCRVPQESEGA